MAKPQSVRAVVDSMRAALARHPEQLSAVAAVVAALLASVLTLRLVRDHVAELLVVALAAWLARPLLSRLRSSQGAESPAAGGTVLQQVSMEVTRDAFKAAFASAQRQGEAGAGEPQGTVEECAVEEFDLTPSAPQAAAPVVAVPLDAVSAYDDNYRCSVLWAVFSATGLALCVEARGDGSLGPLQQAESSTLVVTPAGAEEHPATVHAALKASLHPCNDDNACRCFLHFPKVSRGDSLAFKFGDPDGGYEAALLCSLDDAFIAEHDGLDPLL